MISRDAFVTRLSQLLVDNYVALLGQRGAELDDVIAMLHETGSRRGLCLLQLHLPLGVTDREEFQELVLDDLSRCADHADADTLLRKHSGRTPDFRIRAMLKCLGQATRTGYLVLVVHAHKEVAEDRLKDLLMMIRGYYDQRNRTGQPGERLRFLVIGGCALWRLCYHRSRDRSPFNIARRVLVGALDTDELAERFPRQGAPWLVSLRTLCGGVPALVKAIERAGADLSDPGRYFSALQDDWNTLLLAGRALLIERTSAQHVGDCVPDFGCEGVPEVDSPWLEAFWSGFVRVEARSLVWRSEIHRAFVADRAPLATRPLPKANGDQPAANQAPGRVDVLLITVNEHETEAVLRLFAKTTERPAVTLTIRDRTYRDLGTVNGARVFHARSEMGSAGPGGTQQSVDKAIRALHPRAVVAVGIAFGINQKKQAIGDILLSTQLRLFDLQRAGKSIVLRGDKPHSSPRLIDLFEGVAQSTWQGAKVRSGVILSGDKLVDNLDYRNQLVGFEPEAVGGEMEGAGVYVASQDHKVDWIVIKAICDWGDGHKATNKKGRQRKAAQSAVEFLLHTLQEVSLVPARTRARRRSPARYNA
jgi:nucleoside phosphorylase